MLLAAASRILPRQRWGALLVTPQTLLRWHRELIRRKWRYGRRSQGRPPLDPETVELIVRMARDNSGWGYLRIRGELLTLGIRVSATSIRTILRRGRPRSGSTPDRSLVERVPPGPSSRDRGHSLLWGQSGFVRCTYASLSSSGPDGCTSSA
jgi:hypothetical protein